jgi:hypothetical protein
MGYARGAMLLVVVPRESTPRTTPSDLADFSHSTSRQALLL